MAYERIKPEHAGPKNGGGAWMRRAKAKSTAKRQRRQMDKQATLADSEEGEKPRDSRAA